MTKSDEYTYYESNGNQKTRIYYYNGRKLYESPYCYADDGETGETCTLEKHGCDIHYSCIDITLYGGGKTDCQAGSFDTDSDSDGKKDFSITCHDNGNRKTYISYNSDGVTKGHVTTHYERNGNRKTSISYQSDGVTKSWETTYYESNGNLKTEQLYSAVSDCCAPACYEDDGFQELCTQAKHGCTSESDTCIQ